MFSFLVVFLFVHFLKTQLTGICKRLGFAALDLSSPWEIAACTLGTQNNSDCGITRYRNSELALSFVILALFFFLSILSLLLPTPFQLLFFLPENVPHLLFRKQGDLLLQLCADQLKRKILWGECL